MESRGDKPDDKSRGRPAIARRSCDQCRSRKIGCDRGSPCSNCVSGRLNCTHSSVSTSITPKQRVLISAQYERKIDDIAKGVDGIKHLLRGLNVSADTNRHGSYPIAKPSQPDHVRPATENQPISVPCGEPLWDHSAHIIDFVKTVVEERDSKLVKNEENQIFSSLKSLLQTLENPTSTLHQSLSGVKAAKCTSNLPMPPLEAAVAVLRWAKDHAWYTRITMFANILPLEKFNEICRKVYFAVDDYNEVDFILANGYLSCIFAEHVISTGMKDYKEHCLICRSNLHGALLRLPLLLPPSMETIAALTLGTFDSIENSKATLAWTFISSAADFCQRLGYHRARFSKDTDVPLREAQERLFWTVHKLEKGLSLRFGRASNIRDTEVTIPIDSDAPRSRRLSRLQGNVHDQLYSPEGLSRPVDERSLLAKTLSEELRGLINETHVDIFNATNQIIDKEREPLRILYLQCDLVCQSSLLSLILRAVDIHTDTPDGVSDECVAIAQETLDLHDQCMTAVHNCGSPFLATQYMNWAILHIPFVPFSIMFTRAIKLLDGAQLARLENFTASLQPEASSSDSITHPARLYELLCQAARTYIDSRIQAPPEDLTLAQNLPDSFGGFGLVNFGDEENGGTAGDGSYTYGLSDWYYGNQQLMQLLDEDMTF